MAEGQPPAGLDGYGMARRLITIGVLGVLALGGEAYAQDLGEALEFIEDTVGEKEIQGYEHLRDGAPKHEALPMLNARDVEMGKPLDTYDCWESPVDGGPTVMRTSGEQTWATRACHEHKFRQNSVRGFKTLGDRPRIPKRIIDQMIAPAAARWNVHPTLIEAIIRFASGYRPGAISNEGHMGLMQLDPELLDYVGIRNHGDLLDPQNNINVGTEYCARMIVRLGGYMSAVTAWYDGPYALVRDGWNGNDPKLLWFVREVDRLYYAHGRANRFPHEIAADSMTFIWTWMQR